MVECKAKRPLWLPYVEVGDIFAVTERARALGAAVTVEPREGPTGLAQLDRRAGGRRGRALAAQDGLSQRRLLT